MGDTNIGGQAAEWVAVDALKPWADNPRKNDAAVDKIAKSIARFGFGAPILARKKNGEVIAGHTRLKAALKLGITDVPVRFLDLSADDAHQLALADNRLAEIAEWDDDALGAILADMNQRGVDVSDVGFDTAEVNKMISDVSFGGDVTDDAADISRPDELQKKWNTQAGQLWNIGKHRLSVCDCTDAQSVARMFGAERATLMWTDPPYGVAYVGKTGDSLKIDNDSLSQSDLASFLASAFTAASTVLADDASFYVAHPQGPLAVAFYESFAMVGWNLLQGLVWVKNTFAMGRSDYHYMHEPIAYGYVSGKSRRMSGKDGWYGGDNATSVFTYDKPQRNAEHPTMKPVELVAEMVKNSCAPGGLVYDPFLGSGTTMLAAEKLGRTCFGCELSPSYAAVILERMSDIGLEPSIG